METRPTNDERELFVSFLAKLLAEPARAAIAETEEWERHLIPSGPEPEDNGARGQALFVDLPIDEFVMEVIKRLLGKLYDLRDTDMKISMAFMTIMAVIKKLPKEK